jgi:hypothetical protein
MLVDEITGREKSPWSASRGTSPQHEIVIPNLKYWQAQSNNGFRMWKTKVENYSGQGHEFECKGTNGFLVTITFSGKATPSPAD